MVQRETTTSTFNNHRGVVDDCGGWRSNRLQYSFATFNRRKS